jgi:hypothetical protein
MVGKGAQGVDLGSAKHESIKSCRTLSLGSVDVQINTRGSVQVGMMESVGVVASILPDGFGGCMYCN